MIGAYAGAASDAEAEQLALEALARVGLTEREARMPASGLTTKQLRLMELARALAPKPKLLMLDETLAGLGHDALDDILQIIRQVNREGVTIVIIEHTMQAMVKLVDSFQRARSRQADRGRRAGGSRLQSGRDRGVSRQEMDGPC